MADDNDLKKQKKEEKKYKHLIKTAKKAKGSLSRATIGMLITAIFYVVIPLVMLKYVMVQYTDNIEWTNIKSLFERWLYAGIVLVVLSFFLHYFSKGSKPRLLMSIIYLVASVAWLVYVLNFGNLSDLVTVNIDGSIYEFGIVLNLAMWLLVFFKLLKILTLYADYKDHKSGYLDKIAPLRKKKDEE